MDLSDNALRLLRERYLRKNETPEELFRRVAKTVAAADIFYGKTSKEIKETEDAFYQIMQNLEFLPNSPTLANAGNKKGQLSACFVLPIGDSIRSIFQTLRDAAEIHKAGGGTGFSLSRLRSSGEVVSTSKAPAKGPLAYLELYNYGMGLVEQGGMRRGGNMAVLRIDHPDILNFIACKKTEGALRNFNISVAATDEFMQSLGSGKEYDLVDPHTRSKKSVSAKAVWLNLVKAAHANGEPGVIFVDTINKYNPIPHTEIEATNPCGEQPLLPYESCNLGSVNLARFVKNRGIDYARLKTVVKLAIHFLDNVIDVNNYPLPELKEMAEANRKIGLGVMGFADMLIGLNTSYASENALRLAEQVAEFIETTAREASAELATERGPFPNLKSSVFAEDKPIRNATVTTIAPTGSISMVAGCSSGIEPLFAISYNNTSQNGAYLVVNPLFENIARTEGFYSKELMETISKNRGSVQGVKKILPFIQKLFVIAADVTPEQHVKMQAAFQKHVDNAVSKTVNLPNSASSDDVSELLKLAYTLGCKGITIYRDSSRKEQPLTAENNCPTGTCTS